MTTVVWKGRLTISMHIVSVPQDGCTEINPGVLKNQFTCFSPETTDLQPIDFCWLMSWGLTLGTLKLKSRSLLYRHMQKFLILAASYYLLKCCFWTKTCKLISWYEIRAGYLSTATPMLLALCASEFDPQWEYTPLQKKRNTWFSGVPDPGYGVNDPMGPKRYCSLRVVDPILGSGTPLN